MGGLYNYSPIIIEAGSSIANTVMSEVGLLIKPDCAIYPGAIMEAPVINIKSRTKIGLGIDDGDMEPEKGADKEKVFRQMAQDFGVDYATNRKEAMEHVLFAFYNLDVKIFEDRPPETDIKIISRPSAFGNVRTVPDINIEKGVEFEIGKSCRLCIEAVNLKAHDIPDDSYLEIYQKAELGRVGEGTIINFLKHEYSFIPYTSKELKEKYGTNPIKKAAKLKAKYLGEGVIVNEPEVDECKFKVNSNIGEIDGAWVYNQEGNAKVRNIKNKSYLVAANITITGIAANSELDCPGRVVFKKPQHALNSLKFTQKPASLSIGGAEQDVEKFWENYNSRVKS